MDILGSIMSQLGDNEMNEIGNKLGVDKGQAATAMQGAIPVLLSALANNTKDSNGAGALNNALDKDHDGSILDNLGGFLQGDTGGIGGGILKHMLGSQQPAVQSGLSQKTGLSSAQISQLLAVAAPIVMGMLGKQKKSSGIGAGDLGGLLAGAASQANHDSSFDLGDVVGMLAGGAGSNSRQNGLGGIAGKILGSFFKRK